MNPFEELVASFQALVAQVPELVQPFVVMLAGAIPFIEGEGASAIGVVGGINPFVAGGAAAAGNFLAVLVVVLVSSRARSAVASRRAGRRVAVPVGAGGDQGGSAESVAELETRVSKPESKSRLRVKRWLVRFGVPGASILGPLAIPTHFTAALLIASGTARGWVLLWQTIAIVLWTTLTTVSAWLATLLLT